MVSRICYECKLFETTEDNFPFCSIVCHKQWADVNYTNKPKGERRLTIEEMQEKLLETGKKYGVK